MGNDTSTYWRDQMEFIVPMSADLSLEGGQEEDKQNKERPDYYEGGSKHIKQTD